jgi:hypothetical protein
MTEEEAKLLVDRIRDRFAGEVEAEEVAPGRFRFTVVSSQFVDVSPFRRVDQVWEIVDTTLSREATVDISMILPYSPDELQEVPATQIIRYSA